MNPATLSSMRLANFSSKWERISKYQKLPLFSKVFRTSQPISPQSQSVPPLCKSLKLMSSQGLICPAANGIFDLMPVAIRSMEKLCSIVDRLMIKIDCQKTLMSALTISELLKTSGRWDNADAALIKLKDRHSIDFCLGSTHFEMITSVIGNSRLSYKSFPLRLYGITSKYRDEVAPALGLLKSRDFVGKDLFSFDLDQKSARALQKKICSTYFNLFDALEVDYFKVNGSTFGSFDFHFSSSFGLDKLLVCPKCRNGFNTDINIPVVEGQNRNKSNNKYFLCEECGVEFENKTGINVGHSVVLGTTYSKSFSAKCKDCTGTSNLLEMGYYGLDITCILASCVENLSTNEKIRWPLIISPYLVSVISQEKGSQETTTSKFSVSLAHSLCAIKSLHGNVLYDDRFDFSTEWRTRDADALGIPYILIPENSVPGNVPKIEMIDAYKSQSCMMTHAEVMSFFQEFSTKLEHKMNL